MWQFAISILKNGNSMGKTSTEMWKEIFQNIRKSIINNYGVNVQNISVKKGGEGTNFIVDTNSMYLQVLKIYPQDTDTLHSLGANFYNSQKYKMAKYFYEKCLKIDPNFSHSKEGLKLTNKKITTHLSSFRVKFCQTTLENVFGLFFWFFI